MCPKVGLVPLNPNSSLLQMISIYKALSKGKNLPIIILTTDALCECHSRLKSEGYNVYVLDRSDSTSDDNKINHYTKSLFNKIFKKILHLFIAILNKTSHNTYYTNEYFLERAEIKKKRKHIERFFKQNPIDAIISYTDKGLGYELLFIEYCHNFNIPLFVPMFASIVSKKYQASSRTGKKYLDVTNNKRFKEKFPEQWFRDAESGTDVSFYSPALTFALYDEGLLPEDPWVIGSNSRTDGIFVKGEYDKKLLMQLGVSDSKIILTGCTECDELYLKSKNRTITRNRILSYYFNEISRDEGRIVVIALAPFFKHKLTTFDCEVDRIRYILGICCKYSDKILISLHPKMNKNDYAFIEQEFKVKISNERLIDIIFASDVFISGVWSSTVVWATLCGIPSVVIGWYLNHGCEKYFWDEGVELVHNEARFESVVNKLLKDDLEYENLKKKCYSISKKLDLYDGYVVERIRNAIREALDKKNLHNLL